jgi:ABC-2 type transport system permease protein
MSGYWHIVRYELFGLFISPATYISCFYFLALLGVGFRFFIEGFATTDWILPPLSSLIVGLVFGSPALIPFLTMRAFAEERRLGTMETLMSAPVGCFALVFGKWTASLVFFCIIACLCLCFPLLLWFGFPDQGQSLGFHMPEQWIGGGIFLFGFGCSFTAVGIFASSLTNNQMVAGMLTFTLLTLYLSTMAFSFGESVEYEHLNTLGDFIRICLGSLNQGLNKAQHFAVGILDLSTLIHQAIITFFFLWITSLQIERLKH